MGGLSRQKQRNYKAQSHNCELVFLLDVLPFFIWTEIRIHGRIIINKIANIKIHENPGECCLFP